MPADVSALRRAAQARYRELGHAYAAELEDALYTAAPHRSGKLRRSIGVRSYPVSAGTVQLVARTDDLPQAKTTNTGARPHVIRARRAKTLVFYSHRAGRIVFPVKVNHPGNRGTHWWDKTLRGRNAILRRLLTR
jgi:hypothetical protein